MSKEIENMTQEIQDKISELAYLMWESAGRQQGMAMNYWLAAEKDILTTMQAATETVIPAEQKAPKTGKTAPAKATPAAAKPAGKTAAKPAAPRTTTRKKTKP
jgi:peptidoglycan hydrolase CwlO-like protein